MADSQQLWDSEPDRTAEGARPDPSEDAGDSISGAKPSDESNESPLDRPRDVVESSEAADGEGDKPEEDEEDSSFLEEVENEEPQSDTRGEKPRETEPTAGELPDGDFRDDKPQSDRGNFRAGRDVYNAGRYMSQAGRDSFNAETINIGAEEKLSFGAVAETALLRSKRLFVPPPGYEHALQAVRSPERSRVVLIHGPDHSGKWTCALNLAQDASGASPGNVVEYFRPLSSEIPLASAISSAELPPGTVVLLADCFERNVRREELEAARAQSLSAVLVDKKIDLILTGEIDRAQLASVGVVALAAQIAERGLTEVFEKNLDYLEEYGNLLLSRRQFAAIRNQWSKLRPTLSTPFYIHQFCSKLVEIDWESLGDRSPARVLAQKARDVALGGTQAVREWFDGLHPNEKFLALLVYLFEGAERRWLEDLSRHLVGRFRNAGLAWFSDPREHGLEDARERIHAIERGGRLELEDRTYERELRRQAENRQHLLWETLELVSPLEPREQWRDGRHRQALGVALGRLGLHDRGHVAETLREMATDRDWARAVVPGYALQEVVRQDPDSMREMVFGLLRSWIRSRDPRLMWAAGAGLWRVYLAGRNVDDDERARAIKTGALDLLRLLAMNLASFDPPNEGRPDGQRGAAERGERGGGAAGLKKKFFGANLWCVVDALRQITLTDPQNAVAELASWMRNGRASLMGAGRRAARAVYEAFANGRTPSEAQTVPFLRLIPPMLEKASDRSHDVEAVFLILRSWLRSPGLAERTRGELIFLATFAGRQVRERLRGVLTRLWLDPRPAGAKAAARKMVETKRGKGGRSKAQVEKEAAALARLWCDGTEEEAHAIAQAVVVRCYAIDGALPNLPGMGSGIAVVDPAVLLPTGDATAEAAASAVWRLLALLESRMDLTVLRLGQTECVALLDDSLAAAELLPRFPTQRLVMPGIEALRRSSERGGAGEQVFVMAVRKPHDLDDLSAQHWLQSVHYLGPAQGEEASEIEQVNGSVHLDLAWPPSPDEIERTVTILENGWAKALAAATPEDWSELVRTFGLSDLDPVAAIARLESNARELDSPSETARRLDDPVWRSLALALWWAATDLETCLRWIGAWLSLPDDAPGARPKKVIAQAAAFALIQLYTAYPPDGSSAGRPPTLLFDVLARPLGLRGPDGVEAVVGLLEHWLADTAWADYLAGDVREGAGRLERWVAEFLVDRPELAARLAERLAEVRPDTDISQSWAALAVVVDRLEALRALEHPRCLPALGPGQLHALLVLDAGTGDEHLRRRRAAVAAELHQSLAGEGWGLVPAIYRLGERRPFWAGTVEPPTPERLLPRTMHPSSLIGPLLLALEAQREQVAVTLLLTEAAPVDLDDWRESAWWSKVKLYCAGSCSSVASFSTLPKPLRLALAPGGEASAQTEAGHVAAYLREQFGPNPRVTTAEHIPDGSSTAS